LAAVSLTLAGGTAVGAAQVALFSCQVSQWRGEVAAVTSALSTGELASG
jgi:DNA-binding transcriptional regulator YbjK